MWSSSLVNIKGLKGTGDVKGGEIFLYYSSVWHILQNIN